MGILDLHYQLIAAFVLFRYLWLRALLNKFAADVALKMWDIFCEEGVREILQAHIYSRRYDVFNIVN